MKGCELMHNLRLCVVASGLSLLMVSTLAGCGSSAAESEPVNESAPAVEQKSEPEVAVIGKQSDDAYKISLTNKLGAPVKGISIKGVDEDSFPASMMSSSDELADDETVDLYYTPKSADSKAAYDILVVLDDGTTYELHNLTLADFESMDFSIENDVAFVSYTTIDGKTADTEEMELDLIAQAEQAAADQAAADAEAAANQAPQTDPAPEPAPNPDPEPAPNPAPEPNPNPDPEPNPSPDDLGQSEGSCVEGGLVLR